VAAVTGIGQHADMDPFEISVDGLLLRAWRAGDADAVYRACQDPDIQRWTTVPRPYEWHHAVGFVTDYTDQAWSKGTGTPMGVFDATTGALLGSMGLKLDPPTGEAEIGYWTVPDARGRGVATRAGRALSQWALDGLGVRRLVWRAVVGNHASRLAALRIGVQMEGVQRERLARPGGGFADGWVGSLLSGDVLTSTPAWLATGSAAARQAATFTGEQPRLALASDGPAGSLRPVAGQDARLAIFQDPETVRWTGTPVTGFSAEQLVAGRRAAERSWLAGDGAQFAVADEHDVCVGLANLGIYSARQLPDTAEVGFSVAPHARNRGYATAALRTLAEWGIDALGLARVVWRAQVGNEASRRVAEKAGFTYEGIARTAWRQRGEVRDVWVASFVTSDRQ
jgi:RimJ/RimL family protein N-acetyltransferase